MIEIYVTAAYQAQVLVQLSSLDWMKMIHSCRLLLHPDYRSVLVFSLFF